MILKASALKLVNHEDVSVSEQIQNEKSEKEISKDYGKCNLENSVLISSNAGQDYYINCVNNKTKSFPFIETIAVEMMNHNAGLKGVLSDFRSMYASKEKNRKFNICLNGIDESDKRFILGLFIRDLNCIFMEIHYDRCSNCLSGELTDNTKAQMFLTGRYLEIAIKKYTEEILNDLSIQYDKEFRIYNNAEVFNNGEIIHEFDLVIENASDNIYYIVEVKSGKWFRDFDKVNRIGKEIGIIPNRFLLVDAHLIEGQKETIFYFCDFFATDLKGYRDTLIEMLEQDI